MCDGGGFYDLRGLNAAGLHFNGLDAFDVVTFVENHDFDRTGFVGASCGEPGAMPYGNTCVRLSTDVGHSPVVSRKHLGYAYVMAAEGRPTVWWKDYAWFGLDEEIAWLMALRRLTAQGESTPMSGLHPNPELPQADLWALRRWGTGEPRYGALLAINDNNSTELSGWLDAPHASYELRDYSDAYLFASTEAYADSRVFVRAPAGNYAWYAPTGLYPRPLDEPPSHFALEAQPGGKLHYVALRAADAALFVVNGAPIQPGDAVVVLGPGGTGAAGLGRVGQRLRWDGVHDLLIEVLGNADGTNAAGRLKNGDLLRLAVYDASTGTMAEAGSLTWAASGSAFTFDPARPASRGGAFPMTVTDADGRYTVGAVSRVTGFQASSAPVAITLTPLDPPVVIPPDGGTFAYEVRLQNLTAATQTFQAWTDVLLPNGTPYGPLVGPVSVTLPAGASVTRTLSQRVPYSAPAGTYTYRVFAGPTFGTPWTSASFPFTKAPPESRAVGRPGSWSATEAGSYRPIAATWTADGVDTPEVPRATSVTPFPLRLDPVYPNPVHGRATIRFTAPPGTPTRVEVYDGLGRRVRVLFDATPTEGTHTVAFDAAGLPSGIYLVRLTGAGGTATQRVLRMR
jgi:hypothetical protein